MEQQKTSIDLPFGYELSRNSLEACLSLAYRELGPPDNSCLGISVRFDLSRTRFFQIDCLLFLICILSNLKRRGANLAVILPEIDGQWDFDYRDMEQENAEKQAVGKARSFLVRWRLKDALQEAIGSLDDVLPAHQKDYLETASHFYTPKKVTENGYSVPVFSCLLIEITHMTRGMDGKKRVSEDEIRTFIENLAIERRLLDAIRKAMGREHDEYFIGEFCHSILWESLINTEEHPNATLSMLAMARDMNKKEMIIAISDNGDPIASTIMKAFKASSKYQEIQASIKLQDIDRSVIRTYAGSADIDSEANEFKEYGAALLYSTLKGTSRDMGKPVKKFYVEETGKARAKKVIGRGDGLHYVKTRTLEFNGRCYFRAHNASVDFHEDNGRLCVLTRAVAPWPGNLIAIHLPIIVE